jgi:hypothetical protein
MENFSNPAGRPYAGNGPSVNDDGTPMANRTVRIVGAGSDTTGLDAGYAGAEGDVGVEGETSFATMGGRSAGENSGTGFAPS